jgi:hypothetical protein
MHEQFGKIQHTEQLEQAFRDKPFGLASDAERETHEFSAAEKSAIKFAEEQLGTGGTDGSGNSFDKKLDDPRLRNLLTHTDMGMTPEQTADLKEFLKAPLTEAQLARLRSDLPAGMADELLKPGGPLAEDTRAQLRDSLDDTSSDSDRSAAFQQEIASYMRESSSSSSSSQNNMNADSAADVQADIEFEEAQMRKLGMQNMTDAQMNNMRDALFEHARPAGSTHQRPSFESASMASLSAMCGGNLEAAASLQTDWRDAMTDPSRTRSVFDQMNEHMDALAPEEESRVMSQLMEQAGITSEALADVTSRVNASTSANERQRIVDTACQELVAQAQDAASQPEAVAALGLLDPAQAASDPAVVALHERFVKRPSAADRLTDAQRDDFARFLTMLGASESVATQWEFAMAKASVPRLERLIELMQDANASGSASGGGAMSPVILSELVDVREEVLANDVHLSAAEQHEVDNAAQALQKFAELDSEPRPCMTLEDVQDPTYDHRTVLTTREQEHVMRVADRVFDILTEGARANQPVYPRVPVISNDGDFTGFMQEPNLVKVLHSTRLRATRQFLAESKNLAEHAQNKVHIDLDSLDLSVPDRSAKGTDLTWMRELLDEQKRQLSGGNSSTWTPQEKCDYLLTMHKTLLKHYQDVQDDPEANYAELVDNADDESDWDDEPSSDSDGESSDYSE